MRTASISAVSLLLTACIPAAHHSTAYHRGTPRLEVDPRFAKQESDARRDEPAGRTALRLALPSPPPVSATVTPNAQKVAAQVYTVKAGDTLRGIGNRTGAGSEIIARENGLVPPYTLRPGQRLRIPAGRYHLVSEGDTGLTIAEAYDASWSELIALNGLREPFTLRKGQRLLLPPEPPRFLTPEERAAAFHLDLDQIVSGSTPAEAELAGNSTSSLPKPASATIRFGWPATGRLLARFGPGANGVRNSGIDISVPDGTPVAAAADGTVSFVGDNVAVFGGLVLIDHGSGWLSAYGYVQQIGVKVGQRVKRGEPIALSGDSGLGSAPKLHFEIRQNRKPVDPLGRLPAR